MEVMMNFWQMSDGIRVHHQPHHHDWQYDHPGQSPAWLNPLPHLAIETGDNSAGDGGRGSFFGKEVHAPVAIFDSLDAGRLESHGNVYAHQSNVVQLDQHAVQIAGVGGNGGNDNMAAGGNVSAIASGSGKANTSGIIHAGANEAGNGGDGFFYGGIVHASFILYQPINIAVSVGYGSSALADQTNNVNFDQSAFQMAGIGGDGGHGNSAEGGDVIFHFEAF
jgi:hypothetical protein